MRVHELDHIVLNVSDVERSLAWYNGPARPRWPDESTSGASAEVPFPSVRVDDRCIIDLFATEPNR